MEAWMISLNSSRILINTVFSICITNSSRYLNTTSRTNNCTSCVYSISTTRYRTLLPKSRCCSLYCWRSILINTICRICLVFLSNITNSRIHINTTIRTFNCTIYKNTILIIFKLSTLIYHNTITIICIVTWNNTSKIYSISATMYSTIHILINTCVFTLNFWFRTLLNTIFRLFSITNLSIQINTTIRTSNITIYIKSILTIFKWDIRVY